MSQPSSKRRKANQGGFFNVGAFADVAADEGADDEEYEDDIDNDVGDAEFERHRREVEKRYERRHQPSLNSDLQRSLRPNYEPRQTILDRLTQKYVQQNQYNAPDDISTVPSTMYQQSAQQPTHRSRGDNSISAISQQPTQHSSLYITQPTIPLPSVHDPNLWLVSCLPGKERYAVTELMKKYFKYLNHPKKKLFIHTAFTTDMNTSYIYVEAYKEVHVRRACEDISGLNTWKIRLVPRNEMVDALTIKAGGPQIKRGQWCRFQRGLYKGDLAQVYAIMDQGSKVILRTVPRIDYGRLSAMSNVDNNNNGQGRPSSFIRKGRSAQKLFNRSEIEMYCTDNSAPELIPHDAILKTKIIKWKGKKYKNGFHLVTTPVNYVEFDVTAAPEEVELLRSKTGDDDWDDDYDDYLDDVAPPIFQKTCSFVRGDTVKVIRGAMTNLIGEVLTTQPNPVSGKITVTVLPEHKDLMGEAIMFPSEELQKYFKMGCHVKVKRGKYKDETGLIVKVEDDDNDNEKGDVIIFSDLTSRTIRVHINDITETSEVSTGRDVLGNYSLYELVHLSRDIVGVIVQIQNGTFKILDNKAQLQTCRLPDISRHSKDDHAVALDINNNQIRINDVIIPQCGDYKSQRSTVKHVYRSVLFCHTKACGSNAGIFVCRSRLSRLAGSRYNNNNNGFGGGGKNNTQSLNGRTDAKNDRRLRILHKYRSSRDPWMHKTVKIKRGSYKGMIGIVCGCTDQKLNIELHAKCKKIQIKREFVKVINKDGTDIDDNPYGSRNYANITSSSSNSSSNNMNNNRRNNNNHNRRNDYNNNNNNRHHHLPAQTPLIGGQNTPAYSSNNNNNGPIGSATPAMLGNSTPAYGGATPGYGGITPAYTQNDDNNNNYNRNSNSSSSAWNVGQMTPAHNINNNNNMGGNMTPRSPQYDHQLSLNNNNHVNQASSYSQNTNNDNNTPYSNVYTPQHNNNNNNTTPHNNNNPKQQQQISSSENESDNNNSNSDMDNIDREMNLNPYYFIFNNAYLKYQNNWIVIRDCNKLNATCSISYFEDPLHPFQKNIPLSHINHDIPKHDRVQNVRAVLGKMNGETGKLIGIDNDEAVVQMFSTNEVTIVNTKLVVAYLNDDQLNSKNNNNNNNNDDNNIFNI